MNEGPGQEPRMIRWESEAGQPPIATGAESAVILDNVVYFYSSVEDSIVTYNPRLDHKKWKNDLTCRKSYFSIAAVNGLLTAIGGVEQHDTSSKTLLSFEEEEWIEIFPPMTHFHNIPAVASTNSSLIVAGGWGPDSSGTAVDTCIVEVMDTGPQPTWSIVASLPYPWRQATTSLSMDKLYIAGGSIQANPTPKVLTCDVNTLVKSTAATASQSVWLELTELPVVLTNLVTLERQLFAVGGSDSVNPTTEVRYYDFTNNLWKVNSHLKHKRRRCFAAVLFDNTLVVAGGENERLGSVEVGHL